MKLCAASTIPTLPLSLLIFSGLNILAKFVKRKSSQSPAGVGEQLLNGRYELGTACETDNNNHPNSGNSLFTAHNHGRG